MTQKDYNKALGNDVPDPVYDQFLARVRRGGLDQVVRYNRWPTIEQIKAGDGPLKITGLLELQSQTLPIQEEVEREIVEDTNDSPDSVTGQCGRCQHCGATRKFEFQVLTALAISFRLIPLCC